MTAANLLEFGPRLDGYFWMACGGKNSAGRFQSPIQAARDHPIEADGFRTKQSTGGVRLFAPFCVERDRDRVEG